MQAGKRTTTSRRVPATQCQGKGGQTAGPDAHRGRPPLGRQSPIEPGRGQGGTGMGLPSTMKCSAKKTRKHLEVFVPQQRHFFGDERVMLPCPGAPR